MSYPRTLQALIIEDDPEMVEAYRHYFEEYITEGDDIARPLIVCGYQDALRELARPVIFHLVILDLKLPECAGGDSEGGSSRGLELVKEIAARDDYPVSVLLIVTGDPSQIQNFQPLTQQLHDGFWHGEVIQKGIELQQNLRAGIEKAREYSDFGLMVSGPDEQPRPPLTLREEDLIRRCSLATGTAIGVDLCWWSAERQDHSDAKSLQWVKTLQGRLILKGQDGLSRPRFFKIEPAENSRLAHSSARRMESKLQHIRVVGSQLGRNRGLLVTDKAGPSDDPPISVDAFLRGDSNTVLPATPGLARDVAEQVRRFAPPQDENRAVPSLFWCWHQKARIEAAWEKICGGPRPGGLTDPATLYERLTTSTRTFWAKVRTCQHGDLHLGNVSLDTDFGVTRAYIIDAGTMDPAVCSRDLATLEISLLLHQEYSGGESLTSSCAGLYDGSAPQGLDATSVAMPDHHRNTLAMVSALRTEALKETDPLVYMLLLLDETLIQLGGLAFGISHNRICRPFDVIELYWLLAEWAEALN